MWHAFMDHVLVAATSLSMGSRKFFSKTISGPSWNRHFENIRTTGVRESENREVALNLQSLAGPLDPGYKIAQWKGAGFPTLVFHHDHQESPFDFSPQANNTFKNIFIWDQPQVEANLIVVRAPFQAGGWPVYLEHMVEMSHYMAMLAGSVKTLEHVLQECRQKGNDRVFLSGVGLGGFAVNLHCAYFNSASGYIPLLAGSALDDVFLSGLYRRLTGSLALEYPGAVRQALNFEDELKKQAPDKLFPLLAEYDRIAKCPRQASSYSAETPIAYIKKAHMTALLAPQGMRKHILKSMGMN